MKRPMPMLSLSFLALFAAMPAGDDLIVKRITPIAATAPVAEDADDPAVWINPKDSAKSVIYGTDKGGGLYAWDLSGRQVQAITGLNHPNGVDVEYGLRMSGRSVDIAVMTERGARALRVFAIDSTGKLSDVSGETRVFQKEQGERAAPMGIALYKRPRDGTVFAVVTPKEGPKEGYIGLYQLVPKGERVDVREIARFGKCTSGEVEALLVDDELGYVYGSDEGTAIRKYAVDPDSPEFGKELAAFGTDAFGGDREGIALYRTGKGQGFLVVTEQMKGDSAYRVYRREGSLANRHDHSEVLAVIKGGADDTDGIEIVDVPLGTAFRRGLLAAMNSKGRNFLLFEMPEIGELVSRR